jgi:UDP-N-acetyl-D-mannosaminuronic acid dehydrogenase
MFKYDVCVIGGGGRVGLPLSIAFADKGLKVAVYDIDKVKLNTIKDGVMPFKEEGCDIKLKKVINNGLFPMDDPHCISESKFLVVTIGTPVEEHLTPRRTEIFDFFKSISTYLVEGHHIILRSTVYPGTTRRLNEIFSRDKVKVKLSFCPERLAEGKALHELEVLPQIVSGFDREAIKEVSDLFKNLTSDIVVVEPTEAELAKLFTNSWRYIQFAVVNQFYMVADKHGLDYSRIHHAMTYKYPRTSGIPTPGFAAGPCLFKDTMQLAAFNDNAFYIGHSAMLINEWLPNYLVEKLKSSTDLSRKTVGILGLAFKAESDDERDSLSFKLKKLLETEAARVICSDPYIKKACYMEPEELVKQSDIIIIATPHSQYSKLEIPSDKTLVDIWNLHKKP